jgi:signal transduction histidine kinase
MSLKLWKQVTLNLLLPVCIASAIILYAVLNLGTISKRIKFIELADDINITLLELRRYEKNIILFKEDENKQLFDLYLRQLETRIQEANNEIIDPKAKLDYTTLQNTLRTYREATTALVGNLKKEMLLLDNIRPLGREIENNSQRSRMALELRRHEKNYIIYREQNAVDKLHRTARELVREQPNLSLPVMSYVRVFDSLAENEAGKDELISRLRHTGRAMEKITLEFAAKKRTAIDRSISTSRKLLIGSLIFLIVSTSAVGLLFSSSVVKTIKTMEQTFKSLQEGNFTHGIELDAVSAPKEIKAFAQEYNKTIEKLGVSRQELENTLRKLEDTNKELIEKQNQLVEARKLSAMRLLASEISHEINNPLSALTTFMGLCYEETPDNDTKKETIRIMLGEISRCQAILRELVDFSQKEPLTLRQVDPSEIIRDAVKVVMRQHDKSSVNLIAFISELPEKVLLDPVLIHQALVNILSNAYHFTKPGGSVEIEGYRDCDDIVIEIKDTGTGITEENLPNIFEPFFSTRKELGGSGLGLTLTKKIVERHRGNITVASRLGEETIFTIKLPINRNCNDDNDKNTCH